MSAGRPSEEVSGLEPGPIESRSERSSRARAKRRVKIRQAARKVFRAEGYNGTRVDMIAEQAGMSVGGFYLHYESKEALFSELLYADLATSGGDWIPVLVSYLPFPMPDM